MRHRPEYSTEAPCALIALAAVTGESPAKFEPYRSPPWRGKLSGIRTTKIKEALATHGVPVTTVWGERKSLAKALPVKGSGIVSISIEGGRHAMAFDGKMVYDQSTGGRWMWVYDHKYARNRAHWIMRKED